MNCKKYRQIFLYSGVAALILLFGFVAMARDYFVTIEEQNVELSITALAERSERSWGNEVRIRAIRVNEICIDLNELAEKSTGWRMDGDLLVTYDVLEPVSVNILLEDVSSLSVDMYGQEGSGLVEINAGGVSRQIDLYRENGWETVTWTYTGGGQFDLAPYVTELILIFGLLWLFVFGLFQMRCLLPKQRIVPLASNGMAVAWCVSCVWNVRHNGILGALFTVVCNKRVVVHCILLLGLAVLQMMLCKAKHNKEKKSEIRTENAFRLLVWAMSVVVAIELISCSGGFYRIKVHAFALNVVLVICLLLLVYCFVGRIDVSSGVVSGVLMIVALINYYVMQFRGTVFLPADILAANTAMQVAGKYRFVVSVEVFVAVTYMILACRIVMPMARLWEEKSVVRIGAGVLGISALILSNVPLVQNALNITINAWKPTMQCEEEGFVLTFFDSISRIIVQKPEGYSASKLDSLAETYQSDEVFGEQGVDVVVVMNESFADFEMFDALQTSQVLDPFLESLKNRSNTLYGYIQVPVFGGGTSNTEFEFLTGVNNAQFPANTPYDTLVTQAIDALPQTFSSLGYQTVALHPEVARNWSRGMGYPKLGFDVFIDIEQMRNRSKMRQYVSDEAFYDEIIMIDQETENPLFLFGITMQNHGGYEEVGFDEPIQIVMPEGEFPLAKQYINLVRESDQAFEEFISYCELRKDPIIVLFFGDHFPSIEDSLYDQISEPLMTGTEEDSLLLYQTPFYIWANFELDKSELPEDGALISVSFLQSVLMDAAGLPKTGYQKFLSELSKQYPVVSSGCVLDAGGNCVDADEVQMLTDYAYLQYALLKGKSNITKFSLAD